MENAKQSPPSHACHVTYYKTYTYPTRKYKGIVLLEMDHAQ